jgi:hypothetical protein
VPQSFAHARGVRRVTPAPIPYNVVKVGSTDNFTVSYVDVDLALNVPYDAPTLANLDRRARFLLDTCEHDYRILCDWFGIQVGAGFGPNNRIQVLLSTVDDDGHALPAARNHEYAHPSQVFANPFAGYPAQPGYDDALAGMVIAEVVEILMSYTGTWDPMNSDGEGLSRVTAQILHPATITTFAPFTDHAPIDILFWMERPPTDSAGWAPTSLNPPALPSHNAFRQDWVSAPFTGENGVQGDGDWFSFGCAILFIYYLKDQLGFGMDRIVPTKFGTLADRYQALTGKGGAFKPFKDLLDAFYPKDATLPDDRYDLFPLGGLHCGVGVTAQVTSSSSTVSASGVALRGTLCGPREFAQVLTVTARTAGFGHPIISWRINGQAVTWVGTLDATLTVSAVVVPVDPRQPSQPRVETVVLQVSPPTPIEGGFDGYSIDVRVSGNPGNVELRFDVAVTDQYATAPENSASSFLITMLATQDVTWDPDYQRVAEECLNRYASRHDRPLPYLRLYLPDPAPELIAAARTLEHLRNEVREIEGRDPELARGIDASFGGVLLGRSGLR